jgi:hypothetical protein
VSGDVQVREETWTWAYPWRFRRWTDPDGRRHDELAEALDTYTTYQDGVKIGRYGELVGGEQDLQTWEMVLRKRKEIDLCLDALSEVGLRNLLHVYYRCGFRDYHRGWMSAAVVVRVQGVKPKLCPGGSIRCRLSGEPMDRESCQIGQDCEHLREMFDAQVRRATERLWRVHRKRYEGESA